MLAPSKEPPCQVQGYRTPLAGVNRSRTRQTPVNQDGSCAMRAGGRRLHSQGTTAAGVGKPVRDPRGSRGISQWQKFPQQHWEGAGTRAVSAKGQHGTAGSALVSEPAARHGTARCARAVPSSLHSPCVAHAARTSPIQLRGTAGDNRSHLPAAGLALPRRTPNAGEQQRQRSQGSGTPQCQAGRASKGARPR